MSSGPGILRTTARWWARPCSPSHNATASPWRSSLGCATPSSLRAQRFAPESRRRAEKLVGTAWATGFATLALAVTGLSTVFEKPELQTVLWPAGSTIVVGLIYLAEGAVRGNELHYNLGTWLALVAAATLFVPGAGFFGVLAVLGGTAYLLAAFLESRRLNALAA
ncbi:hypothetical protein SAMN05421507_101396 [Lentzea jiangxiensis]|uniref:Uncharacterized protein n=1 Tax=Lentzea jiangxiensis TaxID=641025 RepID=A0A1H0EJL8_9PSEU|nr:hypothetical protein SAMN05421507_101396 [Lentzea jiangxiensis]